MTTTTHFEDRLLEQLRQIVAENPDPGAEPQRAPRRTRLVLAGAGVAAASAVALVATSSDVTPSAYAVSPRKDGSVSVRIRSLSDAAGLQRSLRAAGVPAVVDYVAEGRARCVGHGPGAGVSTAEAPEPGATSSGQAAVAHRSAGASGDAAAAPSHATGGAVGAGTGDGGPSVSGPGPAGDSGATVVTSKWSTGADGARFTLDPGNLKPGEKIYITTSSGTVSSIGMSIGTSGPTMGCVAPPVG